MGVKHFSRYRWIHSLRFAWSCDRGHLVKGTHISATGAKETRMKPTQAGAATGQAIAAPTATVKVSDTDELGVWVVGEGVPVVLVHGALVWSLLKPLAEELAEQGDYQVIWYHRRGYNGKPTEQPVEWADQARDVVKILDELNIEKAHVVGHSAGAAYVLKLATLAQDRLLSAVLLDLLLPDQVESGGLLKQAIMPSIGKAQSGDFKGAGAEFLTALGATEEMLERAVPGSWAAMAEDAPTWFQVELPASMRSKPDPVKVKAIEVPIAFMAVGELAIFRESGELLRKWLPDLTMLEIPADNHFYPITATEKTAAVLDRWIKSQGGIS